MRIDAPAEGRFRACDDGVVDAVSRKRPHPRRGHLWFDDLTTFRRSACVPQPNSAERTLPINY
jgi:hypothetical protein